jgi:hypothetical protein
MILKVLMMLFVSTSGWLWWKLSIEQKSNANLLAEVTKLRLRLRTAGK